jgi:hypothetical protein
VQEPYGEVSCPIFKCPSEVISNSGASTIQIDFTNHFFGIWVRVGWLLSTVHNITDTGETSNHIKVSRNKHTWAVTGEQLAAARPGCNYQDKASCQTPSLRYIYIQLHPSSKA